MWQRVRRDVPRATVCGWSHGASEALLVAEQAPELFEHVVGLCPTGLVARSTVGLFSNFASECFHVLRRGATNGEPALSRTFGIGSHLLTGVARDALRTRSLRRVLADARRAAQRVTGPHYACPGTVVLLFANDDRMVRWRDVLPGCREPREVGRYAGALREQHFPKVRRFGVRVLEGDHMAPEAHAVAGIDTAFDLVYPQRVSIADSTCSVSNGWECHSYRRLPRLCRVRASAAHERHLTGSPEGVESPRRTEPAA